MGENEPRTGCLACAAEPARGTAAAGWLRACRARLTAPAARLGRRRGHGKRCNGEHARPAAPMRMLYAREVLLDRADDSWITAIGEKTKRVPEAKGGLERAGSDV